MDDDNQKHKDELTTKSMWSFVFGASLGLIITTIFVGIWVFGVATNPLSAENMQKTEACKIGNDTQCQITPIAVENYISTPTNENLKLLQGTFLQEKSLKIDRTIAFWTVLIGLFTLTNAGLLFFTLKAMSDHRQDDIKRKNRANKAWLPFTATQLSNLVTGNIITWNQLLIKYENTLNEDMKEEFDPTDDLQPLKFLPKKAFKQLQANIKTADPKVALSLARIFTHAQIVESRYNSTRKREYADLLDHQIQSRLIDTLLLLDRIEALYAYGRGTVEIIAPPRNAEDAESFADNYNIETILSFEEKWNRAIDNYNKFHPDNGNS